MLKQLNRNRFEFVNGLFVLNDFKHTLSRYALLAFNRFCDAWQRLLGDLVTRNFLDEVQVIEFRAA